MIGKKTWAVIMAVMLFGSLIILTTVPGDDGFVTIRGRVTDMITGEGIGNAEVIFNHEYNDDRDGYVRVLTGRDGMFTASLVPGTHMVWVNADGYQTYRSRYRTGDELFIRLEPVPEPDARISGFVLDETNEEGIVNATVSLVPSYGEWCRCTDEPWGPWYQGYYTTMTQRDGSYTLDVISGVYHVYINSRTHYGWNDEVIIGRDQNITLDIYLKPLPPMDSILTGTVRDMDTGEPMEGVMVHIWETPGRDPYHIRKISYDHIYERVVTGADGTYSFEVRRGTYSVSAWSEGYYPYFTTVNIPGNTTSTLDMALEEIYIPPSDALVRGVIMNEDREAVPGAHVSLHMMGYPAYHEGVIESGFDDIDVPSYHGYPSYGYYETTSGRDGSYSMECPQGVYVLTVWARGYMPRRMIVEPRSNIPLDVDVILESYPEANSVITGVVRDRVTGEPVPGAYVYVYVGRDTRHSEPYHGSGSVVEYGDEPVYTREQSEAFVYDDDTGYMTTTYFQDPWGDHLLFFGETRADRKGEYHMNIPAGTFVLDIQSEGYLPSLTRFRIGENERIRKDIHLQPGQGEDGMEYHRALSPRDVYINDSPVSHVDGKPTSSIRVRVEREQWTVINLEDHFYDPNGDTLSFSFDAPEDFQVYIDRGNRMHVKAPGGYTGGESVVVYASDGQTTLVGNVQMDLHGTGYIPYILFGISTLGALMALGAFLATRKKWGPREKEEPEVLEEGQKE